MGRRAAGTTCNINNAFGPGTANECTVQRWFKKFCKGDKSLEDEEWSGRPSEVDNDKLRGSSELMLLQLHEKLVKDSTSTILWLFGVWSKLEMWKISISVCLISRTNHFLIGLWHAMKSGFHMITSDDQLSRWTEEKLQSTSQSQTCTKKRSWSLFGGLLLRSTTTFWIPAKPLHLRSMLSKSMRCTENCNTYSWNWSIESAQFFCMKIPGSKWHNQCFKSWRNWATKFCLICHIHLTSRQLTTTSSGISTTFCRENASITSWRQIILSKSSSNPEAWIFMLQNWTNIISHWQNLLIIIVLILSNKDVFECSYNELKFTIWNCKYFFTNLIMGQFLKSLNIELPCDLTVPSLVIVPQTTENICAYINLYTKLIIALAITVKWAD